MSVSGSTVAGVLPIPVLFRPVSHHGADKAGELFLSGVLRWKVGGLAVSSTEHHPYRACPHLLSHPVVPHTKVVVAFGYLFRFAETNSVEVVDVNFNGARGDAHPLE